LPQDFTTNGAVVTTEGKVLVSSAVNGNAYFWLIQKIGVPHNMQLKLESSAVLILLTVIYLQTRPKNTSQSEIVTRKAPDNLIAQSKISIYPNPVTNNQFTLQFGKIPAGQL
jgi:hypothetical protein